ncbi:hypothetical protein VSS74_15580 [Conexibacter stalactiti]|uniref:Uncharacterized protein n=1 Tax=Conexibacter stalactiti TaxID=1940611 RepID=A0ABU4HR42_9ACTN|nr:hypothetical protein [Conexibacter stalactiti]MDW5595771.1 hypothetical protein [Conexibacter stalactiti]MEC5036413.1 hypothetical protein [Conexibacter stalactiti]
MSTGAIIAIVVAVVVVLAILLVLIPRMRASKARHKLVDERHDAARAHRVEAERRGARAELSEREAERDRAEAKLHETRAELHEQGLADDELNDQRGTRDARTAPSPPPPVDSATRPTADDPVRGGSQSGA